MDSFIGIGLPELIMILVLAGLVMGPQRIRRFARTLGRITAQLQSISREFARQLNAELDALDEGQDVRATMQDLRQLQKEVDALRRELQQAPRTLASESKQAVKEAEAVLRGDVQPPDGLPAAAPPAREPESQPAEAEPASPGALDGKWPLPELLEVPDDPE